MSPAGESFESAHDSPGIQVDRSERLKALLRAWGPEVFVNDPSLLQIWQWLDVHGLREIDRLADEYCRSAPALPGGQTGVELAPWESYQHLLKLHEWVGQVIEAVVSRYSSDQWLWFLRRLPHGVFEGRHPTTWGNAQFMAEAATGQLGGTRRLIVDRGAYREYLVTGSTLRQLAKLCALIRILQGLQNDLRCAAKGARFVYGRVLPLQRKMDPEIAAAIDLYDSRMVVGRSVSVQMGTRTFSVQPHLDRSGVLGAMPLSGWLSLPTFVPAEDSLKHGLVYGRFEIIWLGLDDLRRICSQATAVENNWWAPDLADVLLISRVAARLMTTQFLGSWVNIPRYGYIAVSTANLPAALEEAAADIRDDMKELFPGYDPNVDSAITALSRRDASYWPLVPGPIIRPMADGSAMIDVAAATQRIMSHDVLSTAGGGPLPNIRARDFEDVVQEMLDASAWGPTATVRSLRKSLRLAGQVVTDIDAVGEFGEHLVLISCKSYPYTRAYDMGDYDEVRRYVRKVEEDRRAWDARLHTLRNNPVGDNYNVSSWSKIIGVVCTPFAVYVPLGELTAEVVPGVRAVSSFAELERAARPGHEGIRG